MDRSSRTLKISLAQLEHYENTFQNLELKKDSLNKARENYQQCKGSLSVSNEYNNLKQQILKKKMEIREKQTRKNTLNKHILTRPKNTIMFLQESQKFSQNICNDVHINDPIKKENSVFENRLKETKATYKFYQSMHTFRVRCL